MSYTIADLKKKFPDVQLTGGSAVLFRNGKHVEMGQSRSGGFQFSKEGLDMMRAGDTLDVSDAEIVSETKRPRGLRKKSSPLPESADTSTIDAVDELGDL